MSQKLSFDNACQLWTWYSIGNQCFDRGENRKNNGMEEIGLVIPTPELVLISGRNYFQIWEQIWLLLCKALKLPWIFWEPHWLTFNGAHRNVQDNLAALFMAHVLLYIWECLCRCVFNILRSQEKGCHFANSIYFQVHVLTVYATFEHIFNAECIQRCVQIYYCFQTASLKSVDGEFI